MLGVHTLCGVGLKIAPLAFANYAVGSIMEVKKKGLHNELDDINTPSRTLNEQLKLVRETFDYLQQNSLALSLPKSEFFFSVLEWLEISLVVLS